MIIMGEEEGWALPVSPINLYVFFFIFIILFVQTIFIIWSDECNCVYL